MKKTVALGTLSLLVAGAGLAVPAGTAANAAAGEVVCDIYSGGLRNLQVTQIDDRNFRVAYVDMKTSMAENTNHGVDDEFAPLPEDLRTGTNVITLGAHATASAPVLSQSIVSGPSEGGDSDWQVEELLRNAPGPWEDVVIDGGLVTWTHDIGVRSVLQSDGSYEPVRPSDFPFPWFIEPDAASVLEFTVTFPDSVSGDVTLVQGLSGSFPNTTWGGPAGGDFAWGSDGVSSYESAGCNVTLKSLDTDPEGPGTEDPDTEGPDTEEPDTKGPEPKDPAVTTKPADYGQLAESGAEASPALWAALGATLLAAGAGLTALRRKRA